MVPPTESAGCFLDLLRVFEKLNFKLVEIHDHNGNPGNVPPWINASQNEISPMSIFVFHK